MKELAYETTDKQKKGFLSGFSKLRDLASDEKGNATPLFPATLK